MILFRIDKIYFVNFLLLIFLPLGKNLNTTSFPLFVDEMEPAVVALSQLIKESYVKNTETMAITLYGTDSCARLRMRKFLRQLLGNKIGIKVTIEMWRPISMELFADRKFNLILIDNAEALKFLDPAKVNRDYDINEHYLMYLIPPCSAKSKNSDVSREILGIFKYFWRHYIINVSLILNGSNNSCALYTFFPFTNEKRCKSATVKRINDFNGDKWLHYNGDSVFPPKVNNLHKCPLKVAVWDAPPYLSLHPMRTGLWHIGGFEGTMLLELAKKMNFTIDYVIPPNDEQRGKLLPNGTMTGAMKLLHQGLADLSLGSFRYTMERCEVLTGALPYYQTWQIYGILQNIQPYTSLEILTFAFDKRTWLCLCLSLQMVGVVSFLLQRHQRRSKLANIILGQPQPKMPLTNAYSSFFGYPIARLPWNTFTRFVLTLWLIYGVLLRIAYQSLLFRLLQTNLYREPPENLQELIEEGYSLVMTAGTKDSVYTIPRIETGQIGLILNKNISELSTYAYVETAGERQLLAGVGPMDFLTYYVMKYSKRGIFYVLPEKVFAQHITMYFTKHSYLIERFNLFFMNLRSQGMIDYWAKQSLDNSYFREDTGVEVHAISLEHISGVFEIYFILLGIALCIFYFEIAWYHWRH